MNYKYNPIYQDYVTIKVSKICYISSIGLHNNLFLVDIEAIKDELQDTSSLPFIVFLRGCSQTGSCTSVQPKGIA